MIFLGTSVLFMESAPVRLLTQSPGPLYPVGKCLILLGLGLWLMVLIFGIILIGAGLLDRIFGVLRSEGQISPHHSQQEPLPPWASIPLCLGLGFASLSWLALTAGAVGLLSPLPVALILVGLCGLVVRKKKIFVRFSAINLFDQIKRTARGSPWLVAFIIFYLLSRGCRVSLPQTHGDPLYYHLASAWQYFKMESMDFVPWAPWFLQGGMAEGVYSLLALWTQDRMLLMILAQGLHFVFAYPGSLLIVLLIGRDLRLSPVLSLIAGISTITFASGHDALISAKNDGFVLFYILLSLYGFQRFLVTSNKFCFYLGIFAAAYAFSLKFTAAFYILPMGATLVIFGFKKITKIFKNPTDFCLLLVALLMAIPMLIRNAVWTQNPFFPALPSLFPSPMMNDSIAALIQQFTYAEGTLYEVLRDQLAKTYGAKFIFILSPLGLFSHNVRKKSLACLALLAFILVCFMTGRGHYARFSFFIFPVMGLSAAGVISDVIAYFESTFKPQSRSAGLQIRVGMIILWLAAIDGGQAEVNILKISREIIPFWTSSTSLHGYYQQKKASYETHQWMNTHLTPGRVLSFGDNESFFLDHPLSVPENEVHAAEVVTQREMKEFARRFDAYGFRYLLVPQVSQWNPSYRQRWLEDPAWSQFFTAIRGSDRGYTVMIRSHKGGTN